MYCISVYMSNACRPIREYPISMGGPIRDVTSIRGELFVNFNEILGREFTFKSVQQDLQ